MHQFLQAEFPEPSLGSNPPCDEKWEGEVIHHKRDGTRMVVFSRWVLQCDAEGTPARILVINNDITASKQSQEVLRQSEERLRLLIQGVKDYAILMLDPQGRVTTWNEGAERIKGYTAGEILGQHFSKFYTPEAVASRHPLEQLKKAVQQGRCEEEGWRVRKDGSRFWASVIITALRDDNNVLRGFGKVTRDITSRKKSESQNLMLTERLSLATSVAKVGVWDWELASDCLTWDVTMFEIYGLPVTPGLNL